MNSLSDGTTFRVARITAHGTSPVSYLLLDDRGQVADASTVMLTDDEKERNSWARASFCEVCFNYHACGVTRFTSPMTHPTQGKVYSACTACQRTL